MGQEYPVHLSAQRVGTLHMKNDGLYRAFHAECALDTEHIYRLTLCGEEGELPLGVLAPCDGALCLTRRISASSLRAVGSIVAARAEAGKTLDAREEDWLALGGRRPFACAELSAAIDALGDALLLEEGQRARIALPFPEGRPFPLEPLFCFATVRSIGGKRCAVFTVDRAGKPIFLEN